MHWQNTGLDIVTSSSAISQVWFGAWPFSIELHWWFQHRVSNCHQSWSDQQRIPRTSPMQTVVFQLGKPVFKFERIGCSHTRMFPTSITKTKAGLFKSNKICELEFGFPNKYIFNFFGPAFRKLCDWDGQSHDLVLFAGSLTKIFIRLMAVGFLAFSLSIRK